MTWYTIPCIRSVAQLAHYCGTSPHVAHRLAAEQRITDLQNLVDETFQQFALDDSEDEFEDGEGSPAFNSPGTVHRGSYPLLNMEYTVPALKNLSSSLGLKTYSSSPMLTKSTGGMGNY